MSLEGVNNYWSSKKGKRNTEIAVPEIIKENITELKGLVSSDWKNPPRLRQGK